MIGERIRQLRLKKSLSLSEFARRTGMSKSMVSQVERGNTNPSVETIRGIAAALEVPVFTLFLDGNDSQEMLVRKDKRISLSIPDSIITRELVTPDMHRAMAVLVGRIPPCGTSSPNFTTHVGEECIFVLQGQVTIHLPDETYTLEPGDAFYFLSRQPHYFSNETESETEFLSVIVPPTLARHRAPIG